MDVILHLGGTPERARTAAALAKSMPGSTVVVSSEGNGFWQYYDEAGIDRSRVIVDEAAWDTVTNFTHTCKLLQKLGCKRLFVVTSLSHSYRSMLIALACWGLRVPVYMVPFGNGINAADEKIALVDGLRALIWRLSGLLFFSKKVRAERQPNYQLSTEHARCEIGF